MNKINILALVTGVLTKAPEWIRKDLATKDGFNRTRAEEALAALISAELLKSDPAKNLSNEGRL